MSHLQQQQPDRPSVGQPSLEIEFACCKNPESHWASRWVAIDYRAVPVDIGLENLAETREISIFDPKATPNPTLLSEWILRNYTASEISELIRFVGR